MTIAPPNSWYVSTEFFQMELRAIFDDCPKYLGCNSILTDVGDYQSLSQFGHSRILVRNSECTNLVSNVCLHRNSLMLHGKGKTHGLIKCPLHGWCYTLDGSLKKAPKYHEMPSLTLSKEKAQSWNNILFANAPNLDEDLKPIMQSQADLDTGKFQLHSSEYQEQAVNWKIPIEVFLENYHAPLIHKGFTRYASPESWWEGDGSVDEPQLMFQKMKPHPHFEKNPASKNFDTWQKMILKANSGRLPGFAAIVGLYFPNIIIEWWPFMFLATVYTPLEPMLTRMTREFYFDPFILETNPSYPDVALAAWYETQVADDGAHIKLQTGRYQAYLLDRNSRSGFHEFQNPMESSVPFFHDQVRHKISNASKENI